MGRPRDSDIRVKDDCGHLGRKKHNKPHSQPQQLEMIIDGKRIVEAKN
jgi:hypothetical protein